MTVPDLIPLSYRLMGLIATTPTDWHEVHVQAELIRKLAKAVSKRAEQHAAEHAEAEA